MRDRLRALWLLTTTTLRADPWRAVGSIVLEGAGQLSAVLTALWLKLVTDGIVAGHARAVVVGTVGLALMAALLLASDGFGVQLRLTLGERVGFAFERRYAEICASLPTLEHHEHPDFRDKLEILNNNQRLLGYAAIAFVGVFILVVQATGTLLVLASLHPILLVLPLFGLPYALLTLVGQRWEGAAEEATAPFLRRSRHLYELGCDAGAAKELRVFALASEIGRRHDDAWMEAHRIALRALRRRSHLAAAGFTVVAVGFAGAVTFVAIRALSGKSTVGDVVAVLVIAARVAELVDYAAFRLISIAQMLRHATRFTWLLDHSVRAATTVGGGQAPVRLHNRIAVEHVAFRYPGTQAAALTDVSLDLPAGSVVALVGENGAGKTTLVKLLCRLYDPDAGRILLDGVDLASIDVDTWRQRITGSFQDFARLEFAVQRSVGVGDLPRLDDSDSVMAALDRSGGLDVAAGLADGLATQLGRTWTEGAELSTGQWQKLALGRSMMREHPLLTVFDEPTASLDAETEHQLFERYAAQADDRRADGAVTLLVSHRFSTVRSADLIIVLDAGCVVEQGSHHELMARDGLYAELYSIQARAYR